MFLHPLIAMATPRSTVAATLKKLGGDGPLMIAQDHMLARYLPDSLEDAARDGGQEGDQQ